MKRKIGLILIAALVLGLLGGCSLFMGEEGAVYGALWWQSGYSLSHYGMENAGGFPSASVKDTYYQISKGSHYFYYDVTDGITTYGPFLAAYTVTPNEGSLFEDGADVYFYIDCWNDGADIYEWYLNQVSRGLTSPSGDQVRTKTIQTKGYTITLTTRPVDPSTLDLSQRQTIYN